MEYRKRIIVARIIGISGFAGSGKDTAGLALAELGWERRSFADPLRESCSIVTGLPIDVFNDPELKNIPRDDLYGKTPRQILQTIGTEGWRYLIHPDVWVDNFIRYANTSNAKGVYSCDLRFINEAKAIIEADGVIIHIDRPGKDKPEFLHQSETEVPTVREMATIIINNFSTQESLQKKIKNFIKDYYAS